MLNVCDEMIAFMQKTSEAMVSGCYNRTVKYLFFAGNLCICLCSLLFIIVLLYAETNEEADIDLYDHSSPWVSIFFFFFVQILQFQMNSNREFLNFQFFELLVKFYKF